MAVPQRPTSSAATAVLGIVEWRESLGGATHMMRIKQDTNGKTRNFAVAWCWDAPRTLPAAQPPITAPDAREMRCEADFRSTPGPFSHAVPNPKTTPAYRLPDDYDTAPKRLSFSTAIRWASETGTGMTRVRMAENDLPGELGRILDRLTARRPPLARLLQS